MNTTKERYARIHLSPLKVEALVRLVDIAVHIVENYGGSVESVNDSMDTCIGFVFDHLDAAILREEKNTALDRSFWLSTDDEHTQTCLVEPSKLASLLRLTTEANRVVNGKGTDPEPVHEKDADLLRYWMGASMWVGESLANYLRQSNDLPDLIPTIPHISDNGREAAYASQLRSIDAKSYVKDNILSFDPDAY